MNLQAQVSRLREEIVEISRANEVYELNRHHRSLWYREQQELRRQRLVGIKTELMQLMSEGQAATFRA